MKTISSNRLVIELHVPDFKQVEAFYKKLGFKILPQDAITKKHLGYLVAKLGRTYINFYGGDERVYKHEFFNRVSKNTPRGYAVEITIVVDNVKRYYKKIYPKIKNNIVQPLTLKRWNNWDFRVEDPFGFYIRFTEPVDWLTPSRNNT